MGISLAIPLKDTLNTTVYDDFLTFFQLANYANVKVRNVNAEGKKITQSWLFLLLTVLTIEFYFVKF